MYTNPVPVNTTMKYSTTYTYSCMEGYRTDDELCTVCEADGMLSSPPPNCTGVYCNFIKIIYIFKTIKTDS